MIRRLSLLVILVLLAACGPVQAAPPQVTTPTTSPILSTSTQAPSLTPSPDAELTPAESMSIWLSPALPRDFRAALQLPDDLKPVDLAASADLRLEISDKDDALAESTWVFALVAAFPSRVDNIPYPELRNAWLSEPSGALRGATILVSSETRSLLEAWWGDAATKNVQSVAADFLLEKAWMNATGQTYAIIPFEEIQPRWKVIRVDGVSPLDKSFDPHEYALSAPLKITGPTETLAAARKANLAIKLPSNRDASKLTVLVLSGVTALARNTAETMEAKGITYPGRDVAEWFKSADLAHISNEVSFMTGCPKPGPDRRGMRFCSSPAYIDLFDSLGIDIVELTGNHIIDWGFEPFLDTLAMYQQRGWQVYGGGANLGLATETLKIENNGNHLAFIGCSPAGPANVWATKDTPGSAPCNWPELETRISGLRQEGWLPVVTLQGVETDGYQPAVAQNMPDFRRLARAGAVIVSGSQSHYPQTMTFVNGNFVHYGLGNLFFDQMNLLATRQGFVDRHVFYDGRYLGVELLTTVIEEYARPRPMTAAERNEFLGLIFELSVWNGK